MSVKQVLSSRNSSLYFDLQKEAKIFDTVQQQRSLQTISIPIRVVYNSVFIESSTRIWILLQILCIHQSISVKLRHPSICGYFQSSAERAERHTAACVMAMLMCTTYLHNYISIHIYISIYLLYIYLHTAACVLAMLMRTTIYNSNFSLLVPVRSVARYHGGIMHTHTPTHLTSASLQYSNNIFILFDL